LEGYLWPGIRPPTPEIVWPDWETEEEGQRDYSAEAAGY